MKLWLDDIREAPAGWTWALTADAAKAHLATGTVEKCSLDHDLGACKSCVMAFLGLDDEEYAILDDVGLKMKWLAKAGETMPHCEHVGTGYDVVKWMAETGHWPSLPVVVHSANPVGAARMRGTIARFQPQGDPESAV